MTGIICEMKEGWYGANARSSRGLPVEEGCSSPSFKSDGDNCGNSLVQVLVNDIFKVLEDPILTGLPCVFFKSRGGSTGICRKEKGNTLGRVHNRRVPNKDTISKKNKIGFWIFCQWIYRRNIYLPEAITIIARFKLPEARRTHARQCANDERAGRTVCKITDHVCPAIDPLYGIFVILRYIEWPLQKKENERRSVFKLQVHHRRELELQSMQNSLNLGL